MILALKYNIRTTLKYRNDMKATAVEWLLDSLDYNQNMLGIKEIIEQAKEMEKEQIIDAYEYTAAGTSHYGEQYYNETFKQKQ